MASKTNEQAARPDEDNPEWMAENFTRARPAPELLPEFIGQKATDELMRAARHQVERGA